MTIAEYRVQSKVSIIEHAEMSNRKNKDMARTPTHLSSLS